LCSNWPTRSTNLALNHRLPPAVYSRGTVDAGALASYGPSNYGIFRRSGYYIDQNPQGCEAFRAPGRTARQIRIHCESQDCQGAGPRSVADVARARRRGDRVTIAAVHESAAGILTHDPDWAIRPREGDMALQTRAALNALRSIRMPPSATGTAPRRG